MMREIFNDVIMCKDITPDVWKRVRIEKGIQKIATLREQTITVQYVRCFHCIEVFSTFLCNRLYNNLDRRQLLDQGGFRRSLQTLDHRSDIQFAQNKKCREWSVKMWIATVGLRPGIR